MRKHGEKIMQFFLNIWNRVRKFDPRKLTPMQILVAVAGAIVALWVVAQALAFFLGILNFIMIPAFGFLAIYFGYNWMKSRSEDIPDEMKKTEKEKRVDEAFANVQAAQRGELLEQDEQEISEESISVQEENEPLAIAQIVNPETGFKEPDISRLIENEEQKLKEADQVNDEILSQIDLRRKRLLGKDGDS
jgi:hypothetical protein